jgi:hypothetical protein
LAAIGGLPERPSSIFDPALEYLPENAERRAIAEVPMVKDPGTNVPLLDEGQTRMAGATEEDAAGNVQPIRR